MSATGQERMSIDRLFSFRRLNGRIARVSPGRSPFLTDYDRIVFSGSFRRLADKTQIFPLPIDDHVHSRLTHSLEVASIGRSLGATVGERLAEQALLPEGFTPRDVGDAVSAACLAHDLGNPPFGHVGEDAIREFFDEQRDAAWFADLPPHTQTDLLHFEGNAQAFAIVTRIDFLTLGLAALVLGTAAAGAIWWPARQALAIRKATTACAHVRVRGHLCFSTPTGDPGPGPHTLARHRWVWPKQCRGMCGRG
jgi:predicted deoxyguanosinetriphosphate triphosphohydrolase